MELDHTDIDTLKAALVEAALIKREHHGVVARRLYTGAPWGAGGWDGEPDVVEWRHGVYEALVNRTGLGHLCGYVGVPASHPWSHLDYDTIEERYKVDVHGGLTYSGDELPTQLEVHKLAIGQEWRWWVGFDCGHSFDTTPMSKAVSAGGTSGTYRTVSYAQSYVETLLEAAKEAAS